MYASQARSAAQQRVSRAAPAARAGALGLASRGRPQSRDTSAILQRLSDRLDALQRDVSIGAKSQRDFERQADEAESIAAQLRAAFREPTARNPAIADDGKGKAWF